MAQVDLSELERLAQALSRAAEPGVIEAELDNTAALLAELEAAGGNTGALAAMKVKDCLEQMRRDRAALRDALGTLAAMTADDVVSASNAAFPFGEEYFAAEAEEGHFSASRRARLLSSTGKTAMENKKKAAKPRQAGKSNA